MIFFDFECSKINNYDDPNTQSTSFMTVLNVINNKKP